MFEQIVESLLNEERKVYKVTFSHYGKGISIKNTTTAASPEQAKTFVFNNLLKDRTLNKWDWNEFKKDSKVTLLESILKESIEYGDKILFTDPSTGDDVIGTVIDPESLRWKKGAGQAELDVYQDWIRYNVDDVRFAMHDFDPEKPFFYLVDGDDDSYHYVPADETKKGKQRKAAMDQGLDSEQANTVTRI